MGSSGWKTDCGPIAILVCYDIEFPELCRIAVDRGAHLVFVPFNTNDCHGYLRGRYCAQARAIENQVYVATAGCVGNLPHVENAGTHYAQSAIFTPSDIPFARDGIASECSPNCETVLTQDSISSCSAASGAADHSGTGKTGARTSTS